MPTPTDRQVRDVDAALLAARNCRREIAQAIEDHYSRIADLVLKAGENDELIERLLDHRNALRPA